MTLSDFTEYVKQIWKNKPDTSTPLSAERLNHIEEGIQENSDAIKALAAAVCDEILNDPEKIASLAALYKVKQAVDEKVTSPDTAVVGQVLEVEAVDDNGKPTKYKAADSKGGGGSADWDVNDENGDGYVKNRTHWKEVVSTYELILDETTVAFTSEFGTVGVGTSNIQEGTTYVVYWNGVAYECTATSTYLGNAALITAGDDTGEPFCIEMVTTTASYLMKSTSDAESVTVKIETKEVVVYHKISKEYLPDDVGGGANSWNDLTDKPFYTEYGDWVDVLPETTPTMAYNEEYGFANVVSLTIGNTYNVVINGVEHECEAYSSWSGVLLLGNASALNPDIFPDNGQTFLVMCLDEKMAADMGSGIVATLMDGTELKTLAIKQREITKLVKLPVRYLPEKIVIKGDGTSTITCDLEPSKIVNILYFKPETEILFSGPCDDGYMVQKPISVVSNDTSAKVYFLGNMTAGGRPTIAYINITSDGFSLVTFDE